MTFLAEERVLKPLDPVPDDVNEWPDFALREVKIFYQGKGRYADLLEASEDVSLCVVGELMPIEEEHEDLVLIDDPSYQQIKIDNVSNYSFGQNDDGRPVVWAAGKAGWYEITPSQKYIQHYSDTVEAIDLFYFMVDQYQKLPPKRKRLGFLIDPFLTAYQKHTNFTIDDDDEAMETIHKHHKFLLKQMIEEREGIDWSQSHLWNHLVETYVDEVVKLRASLAAFPMKDEMDTSDDSDEDRDASSVAMQNGAESVTSETGTDASVKMVESADETAESDSSGDSVSDSEDESDDGESMEAPVEQDVAAAESPLETTEEGSEEESDEEHSPEDNTDWTRPIFDLLNVLRKQTTFDIRNAGIDRLATEVAKMPSYPYDHKRAVATIEKFAEPLLRLMNEAKLRKKFNWSTRAIWAELEATLADEIAQDVRTPAGKGSRDRHRMKSVLRPSGASKSRKRTRGTDDDGDQDMLEEPPPVASSPVMRKQALPNARQLVRQAREHTADTVGSRDDSPSRQLNGFLDMNALPELAPMPEAQEMLDLVRNESRRVGRQNQTGHLQAFLGGLDLEQW